MTFLMREVIPKFLILTLALLFYSCDIGPVGPVIPGPNDPVTIDFEETTDSFIRYSTNEIGKYTRDYKHIIDGVDFVPITEIEFEVKKDSGYASGDYGVIFGYKNDNNYYLLSIDTLGKYSVKKRVNGSLYTLRDWNDDLSTNLNTGYGVLNSILIKRNTSLHTYEIYFNSDTSYEISISDSTFISGGVGFFVYIGSMQAENFPSEPVDVSFRLTVPAVYPAD